MKRLIYSIGTLFLTLVVFTGCRIETVGDPEKPIKIEAHITIDIRQVKDVAYGIEDMVSGDSKVKKEDNSSLLPPFNVSEVFAQDIPEIRYMTNEVKDAINARQERFDEIRNCKIQGKIGEDNKGHIVNLSGEPYIEQIVSAENKDRETIYKAIVEQNNFPVSYIETIRKIFAEVQREKADKGEHIQLPSGDWIVKE